MKHIPQFLIAAPTSGSGKTTISRALMALFSSKGYCVQPFKCGPDYIDTKYHEVVCGRPSVNLDTYMATPSHVKEVYSYYTQDAEISVIEGMMGLFDGYSRDKGSSAEISQLLGLPVILVVDAKAAAYSIAPLLWGFTRYRKNVRIRGVIFNRVGSESHFRILQDLCDEIKLECFGYIPNDKALDQPSRYLGLDFSHQESLQEQAHLVSLLEQHVDWKRLLKVTKRPRPSGSNLFDKIKWQDKKILVAENDESFSFLYTEHLDILRRMGHVEFFNPEEDQLIPQDIDLLYLPGGYPEKHLEVLYAAKNTRSSIKKYAEAGGRILAECGGMMYLSEAIIPERGDSVEMVGIFDHTVSCRKKDRKLSLGYRNFSYMGQRLKGHEFHYSQFVEQPKSIASVYNAKEIKVSTPVLRYKNTIAGYTHLYWGDADIWKLFEE
ncbi:cobyrinate a,c-diamide synthase [Falsiporphyromonas endometrii]|uniref:Cobyrinate a,c-diamide synthase n=1 Tax=Falsiporphyromonas endometrii TaxID=1387297 RepID=A0ABV9K5Q9_9PORP